MSNEELEYLKKVIEINDSEIDFFANPCEKEELEPIFKEYGVAIHYSKRLKPGNVYKIVRESLPHILLMTEEDATDTNVVSKEEK